MKKILFLITLCSIISSRLHTQDTFNISGIWNGYRLQYDENKKKYKSEFEYKYHLDQIGNKVLGVVKIKTKTGEYADIAVRGFINEKKFYFEEYEILRATRSNGFLWCLKKGVLEIVPKSFNEYVLKGFTPSILEVYGTECTGGYSYMTRDVEELSEGLISSIVNPDSLEISYHIQLFPNPFQTNTSISFQLTNSEYVILEILDINGNIVSQLENKLLNSGVHSYTFAPIQNTPSFYYMRLRIGQNTYTRTIQKI